MFSRVGDVFYVEEIVVWNVRRWERVLLENVIKVRYGCNREREGEMGEREIGGFKKLELF